MPLYADDPDVNVEFPIKDRKQGDLSWTPVVKASLSGSTAPAVSIDAAWEGDVGPHPTDSTATVRTLRVPLTGLAKGTHRLRLIVPGDNDVSLGNVVLI